MNGGIGGWLGPVALLVGAVVVGAVVVRAAVIVRRRRAVPADDRG